MKELVTNCGARITELSLNSSTHFFSRLDSTVFESSIINQLSALKAIEFRVGNVCPGQFKRIREYLL